jgi:hypothetical protein
MYCLNLSDIVKVQVANPGACAVIKYYDTDYFACWLGFL